MALDACVYCDCFEKNNLRCDPPRGAVVAVDARGDLVCDTADERSWLAFNAWKHGKACFHQGMILVHHRLGKSQVIEQLRAQIEKQGNGFPIILQQVLYSGTHTGDWIPFEQMPQLTQEVKRISETAWEAHVADGVRLFQIQMAELIIAAQHTGKPICF